MRGPIGKRFAGCLPINQVGNKGVSFGSRNQNRALMRGDNHRSVKTRIQKSEFLQIGFGQLSGRIQIKIPVFIDTHKERFVGDGG